MSGFVAGGFGGNCSRVAALVVAFAAVACQPKSPEPKGPPSAPLHGAPVATVPVTVVPEPTARTPDALNEEAPFPPLDVSGSGDWPVFHGDAARTGASRAPALVTPRVRWSARVGIQSWLNSPLVVGSVVIAPSCGSAHDTADADDAVYALDLVSGRTAWRAALPNDANGAAATKDRVFVTSDDGQLRALSMRNGAEIWRRGGEGKMYSHPLLAFGLVIVGDAAGYLRGFAEDGAVAFELQLSGPIRGGASADERAVYATSQGGDVVAVTPEGRVFWKARVEHPAWSGKGPPRRGEIYSPPLVTSDAVIVPFARDTLYKDAPALVAFDKGTGKLAWRARGRGDFGNVRTTPALVAGALVYAEPYSEDIVGISASTGRLLHRRAAGRCFFPQWSSPAAAGDAVYVQRFDSVLHAVRATDGVELWSFYLGDSSRLGPTPAELSVSTNCDWEVPVGSPSYSPVAIANDGTVLVGTHEGFLYALEETPRP